MSLVNVNVCVCIWHKKANSKEIVAFKWWSKPKHEAMKVQCGTIPKGTIYPNSTVPDTHWCSLTQ